VSDIALARFVFDCGGRNALQLFAPSAARSTFDQCRAPSHSVAALLERAPVMANALALATGDSRLYPLIVAVCDLAFRKTSQRTQQWTELGLRAGDVTAAAVPTDTDDLMTGFYFPSKVRPEFCMYPADGNTQEDGGGIASCRKDFTTNRTVLTPGMFNLYCEHGCALGFSFMKRSEGARLAMFSLLSIAWPADAVIRLFYDHACQFSIFVERREPAFAARFQFLQDDFHRKDHVACGHSLDKTLFGSLNGVNTSVCRLLLISVS